MRGGGIKCPALASLRALALPAHNSHWGSVPAWPALSAPAAHPSERHSPPPQHTHSRLQEPWGAPAASPAAATSASRCGAGAGSGSATEEASVGQHGTSTRGPSPGATRAWAPCAPGLARLPLACPPAFAPGRPLHSWSGPFAQEHPPPASDATQASPDSSPDGGAGGRGNVPEGLTVGDIVGKVKGLEVSVDKVVAAVPDVKTLLQDTRRGRLKKIGLPCQQRKQLLRALEKLRQGVWDQREGILV